MQREKLLKTLDTTPVWDIVIIGGGATGLGAALDAADRGYKTLLIEQSDFGKGTSSKSTKLIHGGVRYLEQGNFRLVKEALDERAHMLRNAKSCTSKVDFVLPVYSLWKLLYYYIGLKIYEWMSGSQSIGKTKILSKESVMRQLPGIKTEALQGGVLYHDGQFDDSRFCILIARTAVEKGASILNYTSCTGFEYDNGLIKSVKFTDLIHQKDYMVSTRTVINATGAFADHILRLDNPLHTDLISPSLGIHIVTDKTIGVDRYGLLIPRTSDGRVLFAIPWMDKIIIGTTDSSVEHIDYDPEVPASDVQFILKNINRYLEKPLEEKDIKSVFAGTRPLVKGASHDKTSSLPRDHTIIVSASGMVSVVGGKWTTYRKMAEDVINITAEKGGLFPAECRTKDISLDNHPDRPDGAGLNGNTQKIHPTYPYTWADVDHAIKQEMAVTLEDVLARRLRLLFLDTKAAEECMGDVAEYMQKELKQPDAWKSQQIRLFSESIRKHQINP